MNPAEIAAAKKRVTAFYRALVVIGREQTTAMIREAKRIVDAKGDPGKLDAPYRKEIVLATKHGLVEGYKEGRRAMQKKIAIGLRSAPASVRELISPVRRLIAEVRELDATALQYDKVAREYEKWADQVIGGRLAETVGKVREIIADGIREGVPWQDYDWSKAAGANLKEGIQSQLAKVLGDYNEWQLLRVAVTEHTRAVGRGDIDAIRRDEMCKGGIWRVDYKGCEICSPRDGVTFTTEWLAANHPGHPNCYCTIDPAFAWEAGEVHDSFDEVAA